MMNAKHQASWLFDHPFPPAAWSPRPACPMPGTSPRPTIVPSYLTVVEHPSCSWASVYEGKGKKQVSLCDLDQAMVKVTSHGYFSWEKNAWRRGGLVATLNEARIKACVSGFLAGVLDCLVPTIRKRETWLPICFHSLLGCV